MSPRINEAVNVATYAHDGQMRKCTDTPYVTHPIAVMEIAAEVTSNENTLIACLLHDVLEDANDKYDRETMTQDFGQEVVRIVNGVTKDKTLVSWHDRADKYLATIKEAPIESVIVCAADKIHNLQSTLTDYEIHGDKLWNRFNTGKEDQLWWYASILEVLELRMPESPLTEQLAQLVDRATRLLSDD